MSYEKVPDNRVVNVKYLPDDYTDDDLFELVKQECKGKKVKLSAVQSWKMFINKEQSTTKMGFINCATQEAAQQIADCLDGVRIAPYIIRASLKSDYKKYLQEKSSKMEELVKEDEVTPSLPPAKKSARIEFPALPSAAAASSSKTVPAAQSSSSFAEMAARPPTKPRAILIIDGTYCIKEFKKCACGIDAVTDVHWVAFLNTLEAQFGVEFASRKFWFDSVGGDDDVRHKLYEMISHPSIGIITKRCGEHGFKMAGKQKGVDVSLGSHMTKYAHLPHDHQDYIDSVVLFSGDGDFAGVLTDITKTKSLQLVGFRSSMSADLRKLASKILFVDDPLINSHFALRPLTPPGGRKLNSGSSSPVQNRVESSVQRLFDYFELPASVPSSASSSAGPSSPQIPPAVQAVVYPFQQVTPQHQMQAYAPAPSHYAQTYPHPGAAAPSYPLFQQAAAPQMGYPQQQQQQQLPAAPSAQPWSPWSSQLPPPRFDAVSHEILVSIDGAPLRSLAGVTIIAAAPENHRAYCEVPLGASIKYYNVAFVFRNPHELKGTVVHVELHAPKSDGGLDIVALGTFTESMANFVHNIGQQSIRLVFTVKLASNF